MDDINVLHHKCLLNLRRRIQDIGDGRAAQDRCMRLQKDGDTLRSASLSRFNHIIFMVIYPLFLMNINELLICIKVRKLSVLMIRICFKKHFKQADLMWPIKSIHYSTHLVMFKKLLFLNFGAHIFIKDGGHWLDL